MMRPKRMDLMAVRTIHEFLHKGTKASRTPSNTGRQNTKKMPDVRRMAITSWDIFRQDSVDGGDATGAAGAAGATTAAGIAAAGDGAGGGCASVVPNSILMPSISFDDNRISSIGSF